MVFACHYCCHVWFFTLTAVTLGVVVLLLGFLLPMLLVLVLVVVQYLPRHMQHGVAAPAPSKPCPPPCAYLVFLSASRIVVYWYIGMERYCGR